MKTFSGSVRIVWHQLTHQKGLYLALIWGVAMFATGCGKKESAAPSATTAAPQQTATQETAVATAPSHPVYTPAPTPAAMAAADKGTPVLQQLNRSVIQYRIQNHRNPTSVEEVAAFAGVQVPPPPPGKKYVFNNRGLIVLVDNPTK
jgi:hypothetical protein